MQYKASDITHAETPDPHVAMILSSEDIFFLLRINLISSIFFKLPSLFIKSEDGRLFELGI